MLADSHNSFIEENHEYKMASDESRANQEWNGPIPQEVMQFWGELHVSAAPLKPFVTNSLIHLTGYKFETLSTIPAPWDETSREYIENREDEIVNNKAQYCSVVRTGFDKTILCLGGEVDAGKSFDLVCGRLIH